MKRQFYELDQTRNESHWLACAPLIYSNESDDECITPSAINHPSFAKLKYHHRLGKHFEDIYTECLKNTHSISVIHDHIQVISEGVTMGEADYVVHQDGRWKHLEIAIKFFLKVGHQHRVENYLGPSLSDSLDRKINHLNSKQLQLFNHPAAKRRLAEKGIPNIDQCIAQIYGWLYYHIDDTHPLIPSIINPNHARGLWCETDELARYLTTLPNTFRFMLPMRGEWLVAPAFQTSKILDTTSLLKHFKNEPQQPEHIFVVAGEGRSRQLISRVFVVSKEWKEKAYQQIT